MCVCRALKGGCEGVQGAVVGQGEGKWGGRWVLRDVGRGRLSLGRSAASAAAQAVEAQAAAVVGGQRLSEARPRGVRLNGWETGVEQLGRGVWSGCPLHRRLWGRLQLGLGGDLRRPCAGARRLRWGLSAGHQAGIWRWCSRLGFRLGLGQRLRDLSAGFLQYRCLQDGLLATVLTLLLASL